MIDKNKILAKFSTTTSIAKEEMQDYFKSNGYENFEAVYAEFNQIRESVFAYLWKITEPNLKLTRNQIMSTSADFLKERYSWIDEEGIASFRDYILWMCWHEGLIKQD